MKVGMVSLGCPKNLVDSEVMLGLLTERGYELTPRAEDADILIVNTCSFIEPAKRESIDAILEMAGHKTAGRAKRLIVAGCLVERYRQQILEQIPEVDFVIGTNELEQVVDACAFDLHGRQRASQAAPYLYHEFTPRVLSTPRYSAYLKIAEGCDHPCSFCVIPQMRGHFRSRPMQSVIREAGNLAQRGAREITLIGQDTTSYGEDLGVRDGLARLLRELAKVPELVWLRFLYCYPNRIIPSLIEAVAETPKVVKYFDVPLQHASGSVLKAMRRGSNGDGLLKLLSRIRAAMPEVTLRTSMIVGFPGETEDDFRILTDFVEAAEFDHLGVFLYSHEESSAAFAYPNQVKPAVARRRKRALMALQRKISRKKLQGKVGKTLPILVEGRFKETELLFEGRLESQAPAIDGQVFINDYVGPEPIPGEFRWGTIERAGDYDLIARLEADRLSGEPASSRRNSTELMQIQASAASADRYALPHL